MTHRRTFLALLLGGGAATLLSAADKTAAPPARSAVHPEFPSHDPDVVREVVGASHGRFERVKELVGASPALAKAAWDWGFGDWESALGAASHMGRRDIAAFLIEHGARPNLFTYAMLGHLEAVKATVKATPGIQSQPGPHGITLLSHAKQGGEPAAAVVAYLEGLGDADVRATSLDVSEEEQKRYLGDYTFGDGDDDTLTVGLNSRGKLSIRRGERFARVMLRVEPHGFAPGGAPDVRIRFAMTEGKATAVTIHDPEPLLTAVRVE